MIAGFARAAVAAALIGNLSACQTAAPQRLAVDILVVGGTVYDGSGAPGEALDLAISDGRIIGLAAHGTAQFEARELIEATGLVIAPGFIDPHTHAEEDIASDSPVKRANLPFAFQGVTTAVVGNDGYGSPDIAAAADEASQAGIGTNVAFLAGFGAIRESVVGNGDRAPTAAELADMKGLTEQAMCQGALGLSAGLYYVPQSYASTGEVIELARVAARHGGYYDTHIRDESTYNVGLEAALKEAIGIGQSAGLPVHIAHIKALGPAVWGRSAEMIELIEQARASGLRITADQYPWEASGTRISNALVPRWALAGGLEALRERLSDPLVRSRIAAEMQQGLERRGGAEKLLVTGALEQARVASGQTLADYARQRSLDPVEAAMAILQYGDARVASFNMSQADIAAFASQAWVVTGSDGSSGHPRKYASFPKAYHDLVRKGAMPLERFIERSSAQTAAIVGLPDRGMIKPGLVADIVIFDPRSFTPNASYQEPERLSTGVRFLIVNGEVVIDQGEYTGALAGRPLLKASDC